jgi:hypothetical protein
LVILFQRVLGQNKHGLGDLRLADCMPACHKDKSPMHRSWSNPEDNNKTHNNKLGQGKLPRPPRTQPCSCQRIDRIGKCPRMGNAMSDRQLHVPWAHGCEVSAYYEAYLQKHRAPCSPPAAHHLECAPQWQRRGWAGWPTEHARPHAAGCPAPAARPDPRPRRSEPPRARRTCSLARTGVCVCGCVCVGGGVMGHRVAQRAH